MKPLKLEICGWGPYKDKQEVSFEKIAGKGLFLITGATGSGKTTIFDGLTYALFGEVSGELREKDSLRSDFATDDTNTYVNLIFSYKNKIFEVYRNPKYKRPKKRGEGFTETKEDAILRIEGEVNTVGVAKVNAKIAEIIGLDYKQFKQISMLAQGEFQRLLIANSKDRTKIFRDIFNTGIYDTILILLSNRSKNLYIQIKNIINRLDELTAALSIEEDKQWKTLLNVGSQLLYDKIIEKADQCMEINQKSAKEYEIAIASLSLQTKDLITCINEAKHIYDLYSKLEKEKNKLTELEEKEEDILILKRRLIHGEKSLKVNSFEILLKESIESIKKREESCEQLKLKVENLTVKYENVDKQYHNISNENLKLKELQEKEQILIQSLTILNEYKTQKIILEKRQSEYLEAEKSAKEFKAVYENKEDILKKAAVGLVARTLIEGEPCPVCGSMEHPNIAEISIEIPDEKEIKQLKKKYDLLQEESNKKHIAAVESQSFIKKFTNDYSKLNNKELFDSSGIDEDYYNIDKIQNVLEECSGQITKLKINIDAVLESHKKLSIQLEGNKVLLENNIEELLYLEKDNEQKYNNFINALKEQKFTDEIHYQESKMSDDEIDKSKNRIKIYDEELKSVKDQINYLSAETKQKPKPDINVIEQKLINLEQQKSAFEKDKEKLNAVIINNTKLLSAMKDKLRDKDKLEEEYGIVKDLENITKGNNRFNLVFEQYVLSEYFDRILFAANKRLMKMSNGRFELFRVEEAQSAKSKDSLEIEVFDYYTGKPRSVKTLSGGESFKAALALALGMSDTIINFSGAIEINTLFIDEGFGALDLESLDQAIDALISISGDNRLIGIISHVEELKERIDNQIIVDKTNSGSRIKH